MENYKIIGGDGKEYGPVPANTIRQWFQQGRANGQTLTRRGEEEPRPLSELEEFSDLFSGPATAPAAQQPAASGPIKLARPQPGAAPAPSPYAPAPGGSSSFLAQGGGNTDKSSVVVMLSQPLASCGFWLKLMAVFNFIYAAIYAVSIVGLLFAWLPVWMGILMWKAANNARDAVASGDEVLAQMAQNKIKILIVILGVLTLISIVVGLLVALMMGAAFPAFMQEFERSMNNMN